MISWTPEAVESLLASQGIKLAPGRAAKIAAALAPAPLPDPIRDGLALETDPTSYSHSRDRCK